jgi:vacuolar-type H+-ATPase subunit I/STV1
MSNVPPTNKDIAAAGDSPLNMNTSASGNLSFEVVLSPARALDSPRATKLLPAAAASPIRSLEDIQSKLKTAEGNRERVIEGKLEKIKEHEKRATEIRKQSQEQLQAEAQRTLEVSQQKLAMAEEFRQQRLEQLMEKLKEHDNRIEQVRRRMATTTEGGASAITLQRELDDATANREMVAEAIHQKQQNGQNGHTKENVVP